MIQRMTFNDFRDAFANHGLADQFSRDGQQALFDYLEEIDENMELDVIALCCNYYESSAADIVAENGIDADPEDMDAVDAALARETTIVARLDGAFLFAAF